MISRNQLILEIKNNFSTVRKADDYADLILEGKRLGAIDRIHAKKRRLFLESGTVSASIFTSSYSRLGLLDRLKDADKTIAVSSTRRRPGFAFSHSMILHYLNYERHLLYQHIVKNPRIKSTVCSVLKVSTKTSIQSLQKQIEVGDVYKQTSIYTKIYSKIKKQAIPISYMWLGVVALPADLYYLSNLSNTLLSRAEI